jgi:methionine synthase I (cobalamin-dependent)
MPFFQTTKPLLADGAMGTQLIAQGLPVSTCFEALNLSDPKRIQAIHKSYLDAGAALIWTHTFGANHFRLATHGMETSMDEINKRAVDNARLAGAEKIIGCLGPTGLNRAQAEKIDHTDIFATYRQQAQTLMDAGVNALVAETFTTLAEARLVLKAMKTTSLPIAITLSPKNDLMLSDGLSLITAFQILISEGLNTIGINCTSPSVVLAAMQTLKPLTKSPFLAKPHTGSPNALISAKDFAEFGHALITAGASIIGGCCGTTPNYIKMLKPFVT